MALELSQPFMVKQLSIAVASMVADDESDRSKTEPRMGHLREINRKNCPTFGGGAIAMLND